MNETMDVQAPGVTVAELVKRARALVTAAAGADRAEWETVEALEKEIAWDACELTTEGVAATHRLLREDADFAILSRWRKWGCPPLSLHEADALNRVDPDSIYLRDLRRRWGTVWFGDWLEAAS